MTAVCGWREEGKKQRLRRCFFPSLYNSTQCHSERSEESPCDSWHSDVNKGIRDGVIINHRLLRGLIENKGFKTQIMLPFQGGYGLPFFVTQGDAIGLRYSALSGRRRLAVFSALKGQYTPAQRQRLGRKWFADLSALKGQYNPVQRQRLG